MQGTVIHAEQRTSKKGNSFTRIGIQSGDDKVWFNYFQKPAPAVDDVVDFEVEQKGEWTNCKSLKVVESGEQGAVRGGGSAPEGVINLGNLDKQICLQSAARLMQGRQGSIDDLANDCIRVAMILHMWLKADTEPKPTPKADPLEDEHVSPPGRGVQAGGVAPHEPGQA